MTQIPLPSTLPSALAIADGGASGDRADAPVETLAHEFESMLLYQLLRQMRQSMALDDSETSGGFGADTLGQTIDLEFAKQLSLHGGVGIADLIIGQLRGQAAGAALAPRAGALEVPVLPAGIPGQPAVEVNAPPVSELPLGGRLSSGFGWRQDPIDGRERFHRGVDLRAAYGVEVPAPSAGRVAAAGAQGGYGLTVVVEHASGTSTRYAHLSEILVQPGEEIREGQILGRVGSTGRATGAHLHFEVLVGGQPVDPQLAVAAAQDSGARADYFRQLPIEMSGSRSAHED